MDVTSVGVCGSDVHWYEHGRIGDARRRAPRSILGHESAGRVAARRRGASPSTRSATACAWSRACRAAAAASAAPAGTTSAPTSPSSPRRRSTARSPTAWRSTRTSPSRCPTSMSDDVGALMEPLSVGIWACRKAGVTRRRPRAGHRRRADRAARHAGRQGVRRHRRGDLRRQRAPARGRRSARARPACCRPGEDEPGEVDALIECSGHPAALGRRHRTRCARPAPRCIVGMGPEPTAELPLALIQNQRAVADRHVPLRQHVPDRASRSPPPAAIDVEAADHRPLRARGDRGRPATPASATRRASRSWSTPARGPRALRPGAGAGPAVSPAFSAKPRLGERARGRRRSGTPGPSRSRATRSPGRGRAPGRRAPGGRRTGRARAPMTPVMIVSAAVSAGMPPSSSDRPSATGAVVDFGAMRAHDVVRRAQAPRRAAMAAKIASSDPPADGRRDRQRRAADHRQLPVQRHGQRHNRRPEQEVDELRAREVRLVARAGHVEQRDEHHDRARAPGWPAASRRAGAAASTPRLVGDQRGQQRGQRRAAQVDEELRLHQRVLGQRQRRAQRGDERRA